METKEIRTLSANLAINAKSASEIKGMYKVLAEQYGKAVAREIVDKAREYRAKDQAKLADRRDNVLQTIDRKALEWNFAGLLKDKDYKHIAGRAACKCPDVVELVARWYPDTIEGVPACKKTAEDGVTKYWTKKEKNNPQAVLKACLKQIAKSAKGAKGGTTIHAEGEIVVSKKSK